MVSSSIAKTPVAVHRPNRRRGRPRDDRLDATIVQATIAEVGVKGWGAATIEGIAGRAGVGRATIYRRWPSKTDLFQYAATAVMRPVEAPEAGTLVDDLFVAVLPIAGMLTDPKLSALLPSLLAEAANDATVRQTLRSFVAQSRQQAIAAVERACKRGDIVESTDAETLVDMLAGALVYRRLLLGDATDSAAVRALVRQAVQNCSKHAGLEDNS